MIILQKNSGKMVNVLQRKTLRADRTDPYRHFRKWVCMEHRLAFTHGFNQKYRAHTGNQPYKLLHRGDIAQLAEDLREHLKIELQQLDRKLYEKHSLHPTKEESTAAEVQPAPKTEKVSPSVIAPVSVIEPVKGVEKPQAQPIEEKPEIEPQPTQSFVSRAAYPARPLGYAHRGTVKKEKGSEKGKQAEA